MKRKACLVVPFICQNNRIFNLADPFINRDGCMVPFAMLKETFAGNGIDLSTQDINSIEESEAVIYIEMPAVLPKPEHVDKSFLLIFETELILPQNWNMARHKSFSRIFTWNDSLVDNRKYFKINWSHVFPQTIKTAQTEKSRFCCVIAGNKSSNHELELYSKRVEAIRWFEQNHPEQFDLYGMGWNEIQIRGAHYFERYAPLRWLKSCLSVFAPRYPSYRGRIAKKLETLQQYKFSICYENARDIPGYITEKIFDCFFAGSVPVYWGAGNISAHIPAECFIDKRNFSTYAELYEYMTRMTPDAYQAHLDAAKNYLRSQQSAPFTAGYFAATIFSVVMKQESSSREVTGG